MAIHRYRWNPLLNITIPAPWPAEAVRLPRVQRHRASWRADSAGGPRENSWEALARSAHLQEKMVEVDCQLSRDFVPVLYHDQDLSRLHQVPESLGSFTAKELWERFRISSLEQVLVDFPRLNFNLELKTGKMLDEPLERKISKCIRETQSESRVLFSSFNPVSLWKIQEFLPEVPRCWLVTLDDDDANHWSLKSFAWAPLLKLHGLNLDERYLRPDFLVKLQARGWKVSAWTARTPQRFRELLDWSVDSVITDLDPADRAETQSSESHLRN